MKSLCKELFSEINLQRHTNIDKNYYIDKILQENKLYRDALIQVRHSPEQISKELATKVLRKLKVIGND